MNKPLVSILIPCYNHEMFLDDCIGSIINQDYENIEFLICDDFSPDNSFAVIKNWEERLNERFSSVIILKNDENLGVTKNINRMLKICNGEYVKVLASDDALAPNAISCTVDFLETDKETDILVVNGHLVKEHEHYPDFSLEGKIYNEIPDFSQNGFLERIGRCNHISAPAAFLRKKIFEEYGFYDENIKVEDFEFWLRIFKDRKAKITFLDKALIYYRINANSMSSTVNNKTIEKRRKLLFDAEIQSLYKYKDYFEPHAFAEIILNRIIGARGFAVSLKLKNFNKQLEEMWKEFSLWNVLSKKEIFRFKIRFFILTIKRLIKNWLF